MAELPQPAHIREEQRKQEQKAAATHRRLQSVRRKQLDRNAAKRQPFLDAEAERQIEEGQEPTSGEIELTQQDAIIEELKNAKLENIDLEPKVVLDPEFAASLTETSLGVYEEMQPESKSLVASIYDRVKSSDVVLNLKDRFRAWKDNKLALRTQEKIAGIKDVFDDRMQSLAQVQDNYLREKDALEKSKEALAKIDREMGQEALDSINDNISKLKEAIDGLNAEVDQLESQISEQENRLNAYQESIERAKDNLVGRLQEKIDANNENINGGFDEQMTLFNQNKEISGEITKLNNALAEIDEIIESKPNQNIVKELNRQKKEVNALLKAHRSQIGRNNVVRESIFSELRQLQSTNIDLQNQINEINPPIELDESDIIEVQGSEKAPLKYSIETATGTISIQEDNGDIITIKGKNATIIGEKTLITTPTSTIDSELLRQLPLESLADFNVPQETIDVIMAKVNKADTLQEKEDVQSKLPEQPAVGPETFEKGDKVIIDQGYAEEAKQVESQEESNNNEIRPINLVMTWNVNLSAADKQANMGIALADFPNPLQEIQSSSEAIKILRGILVKKQGVRTANDLSPQVKNQINGFFKNTTLFKKAA